LQRESHHHRWNKTQTHKTKIEAYTGNEIEEGRRKSVLRYWERTEIGPEQDYGVRKEEEKIEQGYGVRKEEEEGYSLWKQEKNEWNLGFSLMERRNGGRRRRSR